MRRLAFAVCVLLSPVAAQAINCSWDIVPTNINFGTYTSMSPTAVTATSSFQFTCTPPATATLTLSRGSSTAYNPRTMTGASGTVNYNLFMDAANSIIWGDGTSGTQYLTFTSTPGNKTNAGTIYATIPANLNVAPGTYTDTVQATLNWGTGMLQQFITVTVTVGSNCSVTTTSVNFGTYDPVSANATSPLVGTGMVNVYCATGTLATVTLDLGMHASGSTRRMLSGTNNFLTYEIYKDTARSIVWNTTNTNSGTSTSNTVPINGGFVAYGRIPPGQDVAFGSYTDTLLVTVNY